MTKPSQNKINQFFIISSFTFAIFFCGTQKSEAGMLSDTLFKVKNFLSITSVSAESAPDLGVQSIPDDEDFVLKANTKNIVYKNSTDTRESYITDGEVLRVAVGPIRSATDSEIVQNDSIQVYEVKQGDTVADIATLYDVSKNTIVWANDIKNGKVTPGDTLIILPVSGVKHKVKKGDTITSIAKKYKATELDILEFNSIKAGDLALDDEIIIPDGEMYFDAPAKVATAKKPIVKKIYNTAGIGYYVRPIIGGIKTQAIHGHNAVDIAAPIGTPILAAANGTVQLAKQSGYNGGYGSMIIISHPNGTQTVYGHMNSVYVSIGQTVSKGEQIGTSGNTGKSTGPHLHFEVRGSENPF